MVAGSRALLLGFAYKGWPPTDDMRGAPVLPMLDVLRAEGLLLRGHDFLVARDVLARLIYGFRISVLFGFTLTVVSSVIGIAAGPPRKRSDRS